MSLGGDGGHGRVMRARLASQGSSKILLRFNAPPRQSPYNTNPNGRPSSLKDKGSVKREGLQSLQYQLGAGGSNPTLTDKSAWRRVKGAFMKARKPSYLPPTDGVTDSFVTVIVGGDRFKTRKSTLEYFPDSLLGGPGTAPSIGRRTGLRMCFPPGVACLLRTSFTFIKLRGTC
eukprot:sb/3472065/